MILLVVVAQTAMFELELQFSYTSVVYVEAFTSLLACYLSTCGILL